MALDQELRDYLSLLSVESNVLDRNATITAEQSWREIYGDAFSQRPRMKQGTKADFAYQELLCHHYLIIPFSSNVDGIPIQVSGRSRVGFECRGQLVPLGQFHTAEFFVSPTDFTWTMVHTHEDHAFGGPYFIKMEWIP